MLIGCREYRNRAIEMARGTLDAGGRAELLAHLEFCPECARALDDQLALSAALEVVKDDPLPETGMFEARVMAEFDRAHVRRPARWIWVGAIAAAICFGVVLLDRRQPVVRPHEPSAGLERVEGPALTAQMTPAVMPVRARRRSRQPVAKEAPFFQIPYTIPPAPEERTTIVRMEIPVAALIAVGFDVPSDDPGRTVEADVLVSQDGRARAIRPAK